MNATPRTLGTTSFGSTRGSGLDLTSSKSAPTTAARIKRRLSSRGDLLHSPATDPEPVPAMANQAAAGLLAEANQRAMLTMKSTQVINAEELEALVSMGEKAYVDSKVAQNVAQFQRILTTPRGRVALKSQQYLHEMTNETLDAQRRLLYEVRQRTRVRAKQIYAGLVERLRVQAQQSRLERFLAEEDYVNESGSLDLDFTQPSSSNDPLISDSDLSRTGTATATGTDDDAVYRHSRQPSLQYSDISSDRGKSRPFKFTGMHRRTPSDLSARSRRSDHDRYPGPNTSTKNAIAAPSQVGLPPRPVEKPKQFQVRHSVLLHSRAMPRHTLSGFFFRRRCFSETAACRP